jgi:hypothetical protein
MSTDNPYDYWCSHLCSLQSFNLDDGTHISYRTCCLVCNEHHVCQDKCSVYVGNANQLPLTREEAKRVCSTIASTGTARTYPALDGDAC